MELFLLGGVFLDWIDIKADHLSIKRAGVSNMIIDYDCRSECCLVTVILTLSTSGLASSTATLEVWPRLTIISTIITIILATTPELIAGLT